LNQVMLPGRLAQPRPSGAQSTGLDGAAVDYNVRTDDADRCAARISSPNSVRCWRPSESAHSRPSAATRRRPVSSRSVIGGSWRGRAGNRLVRSSSAAVRIGAGRPRLRVLVVYRICRCERATTQAVHAA
jgi:hypothetical protein